MAVRLSALRTSRTLLPRNIIILMFLVLISVKLNFVALVRERTIPTDTKLYDNRSAGLKIKTRHKNTQTQTYRQNYTKSQTVL
jgi:hypothetical protein